MFTRIAALASASLGAIGQHSGISTALARRAEANEMRIFGDSNIRRHIVQSRKYRRYDGYGSIAGKPHEHRMERARRLTKPGTEARRTAEMAAKAGFMP